MLYSCNYLWRKVRCRLTIPFQICFILPLDCTATVTLLSSRSVLLSCMCMYIYTCVIYHLISTGILKAGYVAYTRGVYAFTVLFGHKNGWKHTRMYALLRRALSYELHWIRPRRRVFFSNSDVRIVLVPAETHSFLRGDYCWSPVLA